jgi:sigma-B regulation protein RsbU (phosphoserine phosphatase)
MGSQKDQIPRLTLLFRYFVLAVMTIVLTAMVIASFWMVHLFVRYHYVDPGFGGDKLDFRGAYWNIYQIRERGGVVVASVDPTSAAEKAGIQVGDSIVAVNGIKLKEHPQAFFSPFVGARPGKKIQIELIRNGVTEHRVLVVEDYTRIMTSRGYLGIYSESVTPKIADSLNLEDTTGVLLLGVYSGDPAEKAGLRPGDVILRFDGVQLTSEGQFTSLIRATPPGTKVTIELLRNGKALTVEAVLGKRAPLSWTVFRFPLEGSPNKVIWSFYLPWLLLNAFFLLVGAPIGWLKMRDYVAFQCSILFLCIGIASIIGEVPFLASWPSWTLALWLCLMEFSGILLLPLILRVLSIFPNPSRLGRILLKWQWVAWLYFGLSFYSWCVHDLTQLYGWKSTWFVTNPVTHFFVNWLSSEGVMLIIVALMGSLLIAQRVETRHRPEVRLKIIEFGLALAILGFIAFFSLRWMYKIVPESWGPTYGFLTFYLPVILFIAFPLSFAYSILARKVFGIRFIIRKGLQHLLLSKGALLLEGVIIFFIVWQAVGKGGSRLAGSPIAVSGVAVASAVLVMGTLSRVNRKLMPVIDRRFFRETLDVRHLLLELGDQLSEFREKEKILKRTAVTVLKALHPFRVVLFLKEAQTKDIKCVLDLKNGTSRLASIEDLEKEAVSIPSLELKSEDSAIQQLEKGKSWLAVYPEKLDPENEQERRLFELNCELLIGLQGSSGLIGVMGLGAKLSEEPFSGEDRELLLTVARQMGMALENAELLEVAKREAEFSRELEIARQVQQNLFPKKLPTPSGWEFAGFCRPAKAVGGDYYDIFEVTPGKVVFALGDVSGKGLGPSFLMSSVHATIRTQAVTSLDNPVKLITELNRYLLTSSSPETFITLFFGLLDLDTGELRYINCGHPAGILMRPDEKKHEGLDEGGPILGILDGVPYKEGVCRLNKGDFLVLFSDGVTEATNQQEEMFEEERLLQVLSEKSLPGASAILDMIFKSVDSFATGCEQADDISVVIVRRL